MKKQKKDDFPKGEIVIYKTKDGHAKLEVNLREETVWLDAHRIAMLFDVNRPAVVKHISNIYRTGELDEKPTCSILEQVRGHYVYLHIRAVAFYATIEVCSKMELA